jgi:glutathione S-transferase
MITVHHLEMSRSHRVLWMLEEIGAPYEMVTHQRNPMTRLAPPELKAIHPLGKAPVIVDGGVVIAESGAIIEYLVETYAGGRFKPAAGSPEWREYLQWMHFAEGSAMLPLLLKLYTTFLGEAAGPLMPRIDGEIDNHFSFMNGALNGREFVLTSGFSAADVQCAYVLEGAAATGALSRYANLGVYHERIKARPAYQRAVEKGGPIALKLR